MAYRSSSEIFLSGLITEENGFQLIFKLKSVLLILLIQSLNIYLVHYRLSTFQCLLLGIKHYE